jgi:hypothetical protein
MARVAGSAYIREAFPTAFVLAAMRLLARVGASMDGQGAALDEALAAAGPVARIGPLVGMDTIVSLQVRLPIEHLSDSVSSHPAPDHGLVDRTLGQSSLGHENGRG